MNSKAKAQLERLKKENKEPEMKPNGSHRGDSFIYIPKNQKYYDWYYSDKTATNKGDTK